MAYKVPDRWKLSRVAKIFNVWPTCSCKRPRVATCGNVWFLLSPALTIKKELEQLKNYVLSCPYSKILDYFLYKQFEELLEKTGEELNGDETIAKDTFIAFMKSITGQVSSKEIKNYMNQKYLSEDEFKEIYKGTLWF